MMKSLKEIEEEKIEQEEFDRIVDENYRRQKALEDRKSTRLNSSH